MSAPVRAGAGWYRYNKSAPRWEDTKFGKWLDPAVYGPPREQHGYSLEVAPLAQQPAAVDEAMVERACKAAVAQCAPDEVWPDNYRDADDLRAMMQAALAAALAAQPGGRSHD